MTQTWTDWTHVTKLDPDKELQPEDSYEDVAATGTDALEIGGTTGMTEEKMERVIDACAAHDIPLYQEPSNPAVVVEDSALDGYLIPTVLNAGDVNWVTGAHKEWVRVSDDIDWERTFTEAYIVLNPDASVATYTSADCDLDRDDVAAYAEAAEQMFGQDIIYVEYSGMYGDPELVEGASNAVDDAAVFYGGGIRDFESAREMSAIADTVVVGDLVYDDGVDALQETVDGATAGADS